MTRTPVPLLLFGGLTIHKSLLEPLAIAAESSFRSSGNVKVSGWNENSSKNGKIMEIEFEDEKTHLETFASWYSWICRGCLFWLFDAIWGTWRVWRPDEIPWRRSNRLLFLQTDRLLPKKRPIYCDLFSAKCIFSNCISHFQLLCALTWHLRRG